MQRIVVIALALVVAGCGHIPRLVGFNCAGAQGPLYADEEDHFPAPCSVIRANDDR